MKKINLIISVLILIILVSISAVFYFYIKNNDLLKDLNQKNIEIENLKVEVSKNLLSKSKFYNDDNFMTCMSEKIVSCESNVANNIENWNCEMISDEKEQIKCNDNKNYNLALIDWKSEKCNEITREDLKENCNNVIIKKEAENNKELSYLENLWSCNKIINDNVLKNDCKYAIIFNEVVKINKDKKEKQYVSILTWEKVDIYWDINKIKKDYIKLKKVEEKQYKIEIQKEIDIEIEKIEKEYIDKNEKNDIEEKQNKVNEILNYFNKEENFDIIEKEVKEIDYSKLKEIYLDYDLSICNKLWLVDWRKCKNEFLYFYKRIDKDCNWITDTKIKNNCLTK